MALAHVKGAAVLRPEQHFAIFSTDTITPYLAVDATYLDQDPIYGEYDPQYEWVGRGSTTPTLGGVAIQDFGSIQADRKIYIKESTFALSKASRDALEIKYAAQQEWNFTDGEEVFRVRFSRSPRGFKSWKNMVMWWDGMRVSSPPPASFVVYNYEILLLVVSKLI